MAISLQFRYVLSPPPFTILRQGLTWPAQAGLELGVDKK